jgi:amino acid transporter
MIFIVGTEGGRGAIDSAWQGVGRPAIPWGKFDNSGFTMLVSATAPVFWTFFLLTGISFFVLRVKDPHIERPFKLPIPAYPILPLIFCAFCVWMLYRSVLWAEELAVIGVLPLLAAVPLYFLSKHTPHVDELVAPVSEPPPVEPAQ